MDALLARREQMVAWAKMRWAVKAPPPLPSGEDDDQRALLLAEQNGMAEALERLTDAAERLKMDIRFKKSLQYRASS